MLRRCGTTTSLRCAATWSTPRLLDRADGAVLAHRRPGGRLTSRRICGISSRGGVPPFYVMRVIDAVVRAARSRAARATTCRPASRRRRRRRRSARRLAQRRRRRPARLHQRARHPRRCARRSPGTTSAPDGIDGRPGDRGGHHRLVRRLPARVPRRLRRRRHRGDGPARLSGLPQHARRAGLPGRRTAVRAGDPLPADRRAARRAAASRRPASCIASPANPDRHDGRRPPSSPRWSPGATRTAPG